MELVLQTSHGKQHVKCFLASFCISETGDPVMTGCEGEVFKFMGFIDKEMINAEFHKGQRVIFLVIDLAKHFLEAHFQVVLSYLQSFQHSFGYAASLAFQ